MGKRELLLVLILIAAGAVVYHATAPPSAPGDQGFSVSRLIDLARRHVRGNRASAETTTAGVYPVAGATTELRVTGMARSLTITGEDRSDIASELHVSSNGYDDEEAKRLATATTLKTSEAGGRITVTISYPLQANQRATLVLRIPTRMHVSIARYSGTLAITNTSDVDLVDTRGEATIGQLTGRLSASHRGGELTVADVGSLKLTVRGADVRLARVTGDATIQAQGGEIRGSELGGAIDIEANGTDVALESLESTHAPIHVTATNGSVKLAGVRSDTRVDGHNARIDVTQHTPASLAVYSDGSEPMEVAPAHGGYVLDAAASGGDIHLPAGLPQVITDGAERHASGAVEGGGPTLTLRATRGDIVIRTPESASPPAPPAPPPPPKPPASKDGP